MTAYPTDAQAKADILAAGRKIYQRGLVAANDGNLSVRVGENALWVTPTGVSKGELRPDMLLELDAGGALLSPGAGRGACLRSVIKLTPRWW